MEHNSTDVEQARVGGQPGADVEVGTKSPWLDRNNQFSCASYMVVVGAVAALASWLTKQNVRESTGEALNCFLMAAFFLATILLCGTPFISGRTDLSWTLTITVTFLTLFEGTATIAANVALLRCINKSYLALVTIPVFGFMFIVQVLFYHEMKLKQNQETPGDSDDREPTINNCFKIAVDTAATGFLVQFALITSGNFRMNGTKHSVIVAFITSSLGIFALIITSCPLRFKSDPMHGFLKVFPTVMVLSLEILVAIYSVEFMHLIKLLLATLIPLVVEIVCRWVLKRWEQQNTTSSSECVEVDSWYGTIVKLVSTMLPLLYSVVIGSGGDVRYNFEHSVFFLHFVTTMSLIRMLFPLRRRSQFQNGKVKVIEAAFYSIPGVFAVVSVALFLHHEVAFGSPKK